MTEKELCAAATNAMKNAYAPYSSYTVGAALECENGKIYLGCNIENASFSPTVCAERVAVFKALSEGERKFIRIAVAGGKNGNIQGAFSPCGVCRQVLREFCPPSFEILVVTSQNSYEKHTLSELLPFSFSSDSMK